MNLRYVENIVRQQCYKYTYRASHVSRWLGTLLKRIFYENSLFDALIAI